MGRAALVRREWMSQKLRYESLAIYASEIATNGAVSGIMKGTSAAVRGEYGKGKSSVLAAHPELTDGLHHIPTVVKWLAEAKTSNAKRHKSDRQ